MLLFIWQWRAASLAGDGRHSITYHKNKSGELGALTEETKAVPAIQVSRLTAKRGKKASASKHEHRNGAAGTFFKFKKERKGRRGFGWFKVRRLHGSVPRKSPSFNFCHFVQTNPIIFWLCSFFGPLPQFFTSEFFFKALFFP